MKGRLLQVVAAVAGGNKVEFCRMMGWQKQYLHYMLTTGTIGLEPIKTVLLRLPQVDARWLILGQGEMMTET